MSKQPPPAPTASAIGPCPTIIQIGTGSLPRTITPPDHPLLVSRPPLFYRIMIHPPPFTHPKYSAKVQKGFYHIWLGGYIGHVTGTVWTFFVSANPEGYIWNMVTIGLVAFEEMLEIVKLWLSCGSKVKQWPWPLLLSNVHVLTQTTLITIFGHNLQNFPWNPVY